MPQMDSTAKAAVEGDHAPAWFIWIDILGDPLRVTTFGQDVLFASTGDPDLDGKTFISFDHRALTVGDVSNSESGSDTLSVDLSGIASIDATLMSEIADTTKWRGRVVRLWFQVYDPTGVTPQGAISAYYTGYASSVKVLPSAKTQTLRLDIENYLAASSEASNRSYLNQKDFDSADTSAQATIAAANMGHGTPVSSSGGGGGGGGGSSRYDGIGSRLLVERS